MRNSAKILVLGLYLCTRIWICATIGLFKKPLLICNRVAGKFYMHFWHLLSLSRAQDKVLGTALQMLLTGVRKMPFSILFRAVTKGQELGIFPDYTYREHDPLSLSQEKKRKTEPKELPSCSTPHQHVLMYTPYKERGGSDHITSSSVS